MNCSTMLLSFRSIPIIGTESALAHAESSGPFVAENALYSQIDVVSSSRLSNVFRGI